MGETDMKMTRKDYDKIVKLIDKHSTNCAKIGQKLLTCKNPFELLSGVLYAPSTYLELKNEIWKFVDEK